MKTLKPRDVVLETSVSVYETSVSVSRALLCGLGLERQGLGLGLDTYGLRLEGLVSDIFKTITLYEYLFFSVFFTEKKQQLQKSFAAYTCVTSAALAKLQWIPRPSHFTSRRNGCICN